MQRWRWAFAVGPCIFAGAVGACGLEYGGQQYSPPQEAGVDSTFETSTPDVIEETSPPSDGGVEADVGIEAGPLSPPEIPGVFMWLRSDMKVQLSDAGTADADAGESVVVSWDDSSGASDPARNAVAPNMGSAPAWVASAPAFNNRPVVRFEDYKRLTTGVVTIVQPATVFVVGVAAPGGASNKYFLDSTTIGSQFAILASPPSGDGVQFNAGTLTTGASPSGAVPQSVVAVFAGPSSAFYVSSRTARIANPGPNGALGLTIGNYVDGTLYSNKGGIAEIAVWKRALTPLEVQSIQGYAGSRYGIVVTP